MPDTDSGKEPIEFDRQADLAAYTSADVGLWARVLEHLRESQILQDRIKLFLVMLGGFLAAFAQLPLPVLDWVKVLMGSVGAAMALFGGFLLLKADRGYFDLVMEARNTLSMWGRALNARDAVEHTKRQVQADLAREQALTVAFDNIIRFLENALSRANASLDERLNMFVSEAAPSLIEPLQLGMASDWTISVFRKAKVAGKVCMCRVASHWKEPSSAALDKRTWARGKGWTGKAWLNGEETPDSPFVIETDASTANARARYDTDGQERDDDYLRFRSVVSIPIRVRGKGEVFGVVTATSSTPGTFGMDSGSAARRNFDTIKSFALLVAALIASEDTSDLPQPASA